MTTEKKSVISLVLVGSLFLLTGCLGDKNKDVDTTFDASANMTGNGEVLLSIDGKPVIYAGDFEDQKAMALQSNQQMNMILQMMPETEYTLFFKSLEAGQLMKEWVVRNKIDQNPELIKQRRQYHDAVDLQLYMKYYEDKHPVNVTEKEAEAFYKEKRSTIPALILSPESVEIVYVDFNTKDEAEAFASNVRDGSEKHFKSAASQTKLTVIPMTITSDSQINEPLKNTVLEATKFPSKEIVKMEDNSYWVVGLLHKKDAEYRGFDVPEIKEGITKMCADEKKEAELTKQVEKLREEFDVVENKSYFDKKNQNVQRSLSLADKMVAQAQEGFLDEEDELDNENILLEDKI